jgi:hypothetical protein
MRENITVRAKLSGGTFVIDPFMILHFGIFDIRDFTSSTLAGLRSRRPC